MSERHLSDDEPFDSVPNLSVRMGWGSSDVASVARRKFDELVRGATVAGPEYETLLLRMLVEHLDAYARVADQLMRWEQSRINGG